MSWFWGKNDAQGKADDPYSKLDPSLREYLDKESPSKQDITKPKSTNPAPPYHASSSLSPSSSTQSYRAQLGIEETSPLDLKNQNPVQRERPIVPAESLFQDGRYAHLWKTYQPMDELEASGKSDADRLADVIRFYKDRKAEIGRVAVANCVEEQLAEKDCLVNGSWTKRMTMCRDENRAFHRCYNMQSRFLKALGYLSIERDAQEEERIQMHADKLYHDMLAREAATQKAKDEGQAAPELPPLIRPENIREVLGDDSAWARARRRATEVGLSTNLSSYSPERQEQIKKRLQGMSKEEQDLELQLIAAESRAQLEYADLINERMEEERQHRADRRERGKETVGDTIKRWWGWVQ